MQKAAKEVETKFSDPNRQYNNNNETFKLNKLISLGDAMAVGIFDKSSNKKAMVLFIYVKNWWTYFFPTSAHLIGLEKIKEIYFQIEDYNFDKNFDKDKQELSQWV